MDTQAISDIFTGAIGVLSFWVPALSVISVPLTLLFNGTMKAINKKDR